MSCMCGDTECPSCGLAQMTLIDKHKFSEFTIANYMTTTSTNWVSIGEMIVSNDREASFNVSMCADMYIVRSHKEYGIFSWIRDLMLPRQPSPAERNLFEGYIRATIKHGAEAEKVLFFGSPKETNRYRSYLHCGLPYAVGNITSEWSNFSLQGNSCNPLFTTGFMTHTTGECRIKMEVAAAGGTTLFIRPNTTKLRATVMEFGGNND